MEKESSQSEKRGGGITRSQIHSYLTQRIPSSVSIDQEATHSLKTFIALPAVMLAIVCRGMLSRTDAATISSSRFYSTNEERNEGRQC